MADASRMNIGRDYTYALVLDGRITGVAYWRDAAQLNESAEHEPAVAHPGWFWTPTEHPGARHRVAQGLELTGEMAEEELTQTARDALEVIANEVLAEGGDE